MFVENYFNGFRNFSGFLFIKGVETRRERHQYNPCVSPLDVKAGATVSRSTFYNNIIYCSSFFTFVHLFLYVFLYLKEKCVTMSDACHC